MQDADITSLFEAFSRQGSARTGTKCLPILCKDEAEEMWLQKFKV